MLKRTVRHARAYAIAVCSAQHEHTNCESFESPVSDAECITDTESKYARPDSLTDEGSLSYPNEDALTISDDKGALARPNNEALTISIVDAHS